MKLLILFITLIVFTALKVQSDDLPKMKLIETKRSNYKSIIAGKTATKKPIAEPLDNYFDFFLKFWLLRFKHEPALKVFNERVNFRKISWSCKNCRNIISF